jgi:hypothetical protein
MCARTKIVFRNNDASRALLHIIGWQGVAPIKPLVDLRRQNRLHAVAPRQKLAAASDRDH